LHAKKNGDEERMRKRSEFRAFIEDLRKLFRDKLREEGGHLYENTYIKPGVSMEEYSIPVERDSITLELKNFYFTPPDKKHVTFYRVAAFLEVNSYYNAFLKINFETESAAKRFFTKILTFININRRD
jgi:hypothetical protein